MNKEIVVICLEDNQQTSLSARQKATRTGWRPVSDWQEVESCIAQAWQDTVASQVNGMKMPKTLKLAIGIKVLGRTHFQTYSLPKGGSFRVFPLDHKRFKLSKLERDIHRILEDILARFPDEITDKQSIRENFEITNPLTEIKKSISKHQQLTTLLEEAETGSPHSLW